MSRGSRHIPLKEVGKVYRSLGKALRGHQTQMEVSGQGFPGKPGILDDSGRKSRNLPRRKRCSSQGTVCAESQRCEKAKYSQETNPGRELRNLVKKWLMTS